MHFISHKSVWSFNPQDLWKIGQYEPLETRITTIIERCLASGIRDYKAVLAEVLSELCDGRTPDMKQIQHIYNALLRDST
jgi:hypothetical protein